MRRPPARPLALSTPPDNGRTRSGSSRISGRDDSAVSSSVVRISSAQLTTLASRLSPTDDAIIRLVSQTRLCSGAQLEQLFFAGGTPAARARRARRTLRRLTDWRLLDRLPREVGGRRAGSRGYLYALGPAGSRLLTARDGVTVKRLVRPGDRFVGHTLAISELVTQLTLADQNGELDLIELATEPQCWRGFLMGFGTRVVLKPDLFVRIGLGAFEDRYFVEVDMDSETRGTIEVKAKRYLAYYRTWREQHDHGVFPAALWATTTERRAEQLRTMLGGLGGEGARLFSVCQQGELVARFAGERS